MNKKVLWSMIILLWVFLVSFLILKLFFDDLFIAAVENDKIIQIGIFIDTHSCVRLLADMVLSTVTLHFYLCACKKVWRLPWYWYVLLAVYALVGNLCYLNVPYIIMAFDIIGLVLVPFILNAERSQTVAVFILHQLAQPLTLMVRGESLYLASTDYVTQLILMFDVYIWLTMYYLYANLYKEESLWEKLVYPFSEIKQKLNSKKKLQK